MNIFKKLFNKEAKYGDQDIVAVVTGQYVKLDSLSDEMFSKQMLGKTLAIYPQNGKVVAPANGKLEFVSSSGHAFGLRMKNGVSLLVHIGIDTVLLNGKGFKICLEAGSQISAGQTVIEMDVKAIEKKGLNPVTMVIVAENPNNIDINFIEFDYIERGIIINQG